MKGIMTTTTTLLLLFLFTQNGLAQQNEDKKAERYRIKIVKNENGKEKVIDETFASREAMAEFIRDNQLDMPDAPPAPPTPLTAPTPPAPPAIANCTQTKKECRKVIIIENEELKDKK